nr:unnamed protein product [Digitaria exilis]
MCLFTPDDPEYPADEKPSGRHNAHGPGTTSRSSPAKAGFLREKGANSTGREQSSSRSEGIAADPGWGLGKELDLMGQGADCVRIPFFRRLGYCRP